MHLYYCKLYFKKFSEILLVLPPSTHMILRKDFFHITICFPTCLGLQLKLFIEDYEYLGISTEEKGIRVAIHERNTIPFPEDIGISLAPGFATSIGVRQVLHNFGFHDYE